MSHPARLPGGFTLIELLVVIAIISLLISLMMPGIGAARDRARAVACNSNLRQISMAAWMYADSHDGVLPDSRNASPNRVWVDFVAPFLGVQGNPREVLPQAVSVYRCPGSPFELTRWWHASYGLNWMIGSSQVADDSAGVRVGYPRLGQIRAPSQVILFADWGEGASTVIQAYWIHLEPELTRYRSFVHQEKMNVVYVDGHTGTLAPEETNPPTTVTSWHRFPKPWGPY